MRSSKLLHRRICLALVMLIGGSALLFAGRVVPQGQGPGKTEWVQGQALVKFRDDIELHLGKGGSYVRTGIPSIDRLNSRYQVADMEQVFKTAKRRTEARYTRTRGGKLIELPELFNWYRLRFPEESDIQTIVDAYRSEPWVAHAEPNYLAHMCLTPNDSLYDQQWGLVKIQAPNAWDIETGDSTVVVGVLDTGIDTNHVDLADHLWVNEDEIPDNGMDDDGNGYIDDVYGWNFVDDNNNVDDGAGHGTHCAGIISAVTDNSIGVAGTSWDSRLMAVKVLNNNGVGLYSDVAQGIDYVANNQGKIINMSLGGYVHSQMWEDALVNAYATSVPVAAAGNEAVSDSFYPACFDVVLGVAATDSADVKWDGSNYGAWVDLSAPGVSIMSTKLNDEYGLFTGTSEGAPFVSGVAALVASHDSTLSTGAIMNMIANNTDPIDSLNQGYAGMLGTGRLNAYTALTGDSLPFLVIHSDTIDDSGGDGDGIPDAGETVNLVLVLQNNGTDATGVSGTLHTDDIDITISDSTASFGDILAREKVANSTDLYTFSVSDTCPEHDVLFKLYMTANAGAFNDTVEFSIATQAEYNLSGVISADTTLRKGTYIVVGNVFVDSGVTLTIDPGAEVRIDSARAIVVDGALSAAGTSTDSIIFTRNKADTNARWARLWFRSPSTSGHFEYCRIEWAGDCAIYVEGTDSIYIGHSNISDNRAEGGDYISAAVCIRSNSTSAIITDNVVHSNYASGNTYVSGALCVSGGTVANNVIYDNHSNSMNWRFGALSVDDSSSGCVITNNIMHHNSTSHTDLGSGGAIVNSGSGTIIEGNVLYNNTAGGGGAITNRRSVVIRGNIIHSNSSGGGDGGGGILNGNNGSATIIGNIICENRATGSYPGGGICNRVGWVTITNNLIYNNSAPYGGSIASYDDHINVTGIHSNTVIDTTFSAIHINTGSASVHKSNICATGYALYNNTANDIPADSNWWGTIDTTVIDGLIYDFWDDFTLGTVHYQPILTSPCESAPPYLDSLEVYPDPVGVETLYTYLTFSKPMNTAIEPQVTFGIAPNDTEYTFNGGWTDVKHWDGWYYIDEMVLDSIYQIRVAEAEDDSGFVIPPDQSHGFRVYTAGSAARELVAEFMGDHVSLSWHEAAIENLLGYNIYRSLTSGGPYDQINSNVIPDTTYADFDIVGPNTYYYVYTILDNNFRESSYSSEASVEVVGIEEQKIKPTVFALYGARPNPCVGEVSISYAVPHTTHVCLNIYDVQGRLVKTVVDDGQMPGHHTIAWGGTDNEGRTVASGVYFFRIEAGSFEAITKLLVLR